MKNSLFLIVYFLFLPLVSYSQIVSHSFEDSTLTVFVKPSSLQSETDTIYSNGVPKKINFVFEDIDSIDSYSKNVVMVRGRRLFAEPQIDNNIYTITPREFTNWEGDRFVICVQIPSKNTLDTLGFCTNLYIIPQPIADEINRLKRQRIEDSEHLQKTKENHPLVVKHYQKRFEKLKATQQNLTEKNIQEISKVYSKMLTPNGVKIDTTKFIDKTEITNENWLEYLHFLKKDSSSQVYEYALPDSNIWNSYYEDPYLRWRYFNHFRRLLLDNPISGITYQQAQEYCMWRTDAVNTTINEMNKLVDSDYEIIVHYRLPTKEEWEYAAIKDDSDKQFGGEPAMRRYSVEEKEQIYRTAKNYKREKGYTTKEIKLEMKNYFESDTSYTKTFNYKNVEEYAKPYFIEEMYIDKTSFLRMQDYYPKTKQFGLDNLFGNVAEMTSEKGIAKGGSFYHTLEECAADRVQVYDSPQAWLGFRCVVEIIVRKKDGK